MQTMKIIDPEMEFLTISREGERPLKFTGKLVGEASTSWERASSDYSGSVGIQHCISVYQTTGGNAVVQIVRETQWQGDHDSNHAMLCKGANEAEAFIANIFNSNELPRIGVEAMEILETIGEKFAWVEMVD